MGSSAETISPVKCDIIPSNALKMNATLHFEYNRNMRDERLHIVFTGTTIDSDSRTLLTDWLIPTDEQIDRAEKKEFSDNCVFSAFR